MEFLANIPALLALVLGLVFLVGGGELLVRGAAALALKANIPPLLIGLTVVSMGTSAPELFASVEAALEGHPGLAVGNVLGSNVANLALILGLTALIRPVTVDRMAAWRGQSDLAVGNVVGSNLFNLLLVLGTTATIMPLPMGPEVLSWDIWWVLGTAAALIPLALLGGLRTPRLGRWQGGLFVLAYLVYIGTTWTGL